MATNDSICSLSEADQAELNKLVNVLELSSGATTIFAIAPDSGPQHPVVEQLKSLLSASDEDFQFQNFFYSDNSLHSFLYGLDEVDQETSQAGRKIVMAFGIDQLPTPRLVREMKQLNLGRESVFRRELVLIFWLNKVEFLEEFQNRAPDFWDWRGKVVTFKVRPVLHPLCYSYLEWLIAENSYLKISGVMQVQRQVDIFLDQIYVSLQAERRQQVTETLDRGQRELEAVSSLPSGGKDRRRDSTLDDLELLDDFEPLMPDFVPTATSTKTVTQKVDLAQAVRESRYSVILGAPGAGKTTLLRYLALHFATAKRDDKKTVLGGAAQEELGKPLLPIFLRIADYAERLKEQPDLSLLDYLRQFYRQWEAYFEAEAEAGTELITGLLEQMCQGQCLMLLDGLDEVFDQDSRKLIVEQINQFVEEFSANKFVVTTRIAGYRDVKLSSRFSEFTIEDMGSEQVEKFLHRWCGAIERAQQPEASEEQSQRAGDAEAQAILDAIQANEGVKRLTANPLLLTILALIHRNGSRLPNRRVELYALAVKTLTEDWQLSKKLPDAPKVVLKENEVVRLLAPLAYWMHEEKPSGLVTQAEVEEKLAAKLAELNDDEPESESVQQAVEQFLRKVRETTGLFVERAPGVYGFMHLTFEEYFAARHIVDNDQSDILQIIRSHLYEPRWDETILLALGYYGIHFNAQVDKLVKKLFSNLEGYEPTIQGGEIKVKNASSPDAILIWSALPGESTTSGSHSELRLKDLLFAGQVLAEVEVNTSIRRKLIQKIVLTYLGLDTDFGDEITKQLLRRLRQIELFNQKGEVIARLKQAANDSRLSKEMRIKAQLAILYVACGETGAALVDCVTEIVHQLTPSLFSGIKNLVAKLGEEMTFALKTTLQSHSYEQGSQRFLSLTLCTALSYIRKNHYEKAISLIGELTDKVDTSFRPYIAWTLAACHEAKNEYEQAEYRYQQAFERLTISCTSDTLLDFWIDWGSFYLEQAKYEKSLNCFQKILSIVQELNPSKNRLITSLNLAILYQSLENYEQAMEYYQQTMNLCQQLSLDQDRAMVGLWSLIGDCYRDWGKNEQAKECELKKLEICRKSEDQFEIASTYQELGSIYRKWSKYEQAITYYQKSRELYEQLGKDKNVAGLWYWLADCYRDWGKYEQAVECELKDLAIRQNIDDQPNIASAYFSLGRIYQDWGKYEQAIAHHQQSRELYEQSGKDKNVASQWYNIADCYRDWGKYEQAIECQQQCLTIRQTLDDQSLVAVTYYQLGRIYQDWGKYEQAIAHYQQSREFYEQLSKEKDVANLWYCLADCYCAWGKYEQAVKCELRDLAICQKLENQPGIAPTYYQLGRIYQAWGKYEQAIAHHQQSRELYEQLGKDKNVANQWYNLADCYRDWGKYEQAVECELKDLAICQNLDDQPRIALAYFWLGRIYQAWGKYEQAIAHYQQSRELYEQLGREQNVANQWYWLAVCYRDWGKYEQAVECEQKDLAIRQKLDDETNIASAYNQLGRIYQAWGKYEEVIAHYQQSRELYEQLGKDKDVANLWYWLADCYRVWGKYEQAVECELKDLAIRQNLDDQPNIADAYYQLGRIYQAWGKYEQAITHHQQSRELYEQLGQEKQVANEWYWLAACYRVWGKYEQAVECQQQCLTRRQNLDDQPRIALAYYQLGRIYQDGGKYEEAIAHHQHSCDIYQHLGLDEEVARSYRRLAYSQGLLAKNNPDRLVALDLFMQVEQNIRQAIQLNTVGDYKKNLAYDYTALGLLWSERLRLWPFDGSPLQEQIAQFEEYYNTGLTYLAELGQSVDRADEVLDIARAYLEVNVLENLDRAEELANESLQVFQDYNRRKLEASARKLLGEIYLSRAQRNQPGTEATAHQFLSESLQIYRELDLNEKATEVEQLMHPTNPLKTISQEGN